MSPESILDEPVSERRTMLQLSREANVSPPTPWRWATRGVRGIKLPTVLLGRKRITTRSAYRAWIMEVTASADGEIARSTPNNVHRDNVIECAEHEAARLLGIHSREVSQ
jgi:hypothetical protein